MSTVDHSPSTLSAISALENLRKRMLDLTARNRLINYRHTKSNSLRLIDELPNQLTRQLLNDVEMRFRAVPEPTEQELIDYGYLRYNEDTGSIERLKRDPSAEEWARTLGLNTDFDLPQSGTEVDESAKHIDKHIQTALYPYELEARLNSLHQKSNSAIEEMGANILYLAFGFLEWYESNHSETPRIAPLFLLPVQLHKGKLNSLNRTYEYTLNFSGEDIIPNLSLREKLRVDFALALPDLDENTEPEDYFAQVEGMLMPNLKRWRIRRFGTLTLLNFSKLLMYLDLDPARWPAGKKITDHPVVNQFLAGYSAEQEPKQDASVSFAEEHSVDDLKDVHRNYPLIDDADSSQHSALIDALDGHNLVIEGPPGTGKSQTITNLIAASIAQGKRVLFVAEKLAALEVVHSRLEKAGLSDFCLELHSHKSQKRQVLDDIAVRMKKRGRYRNSAVLVTEILRYESLKEKLRNHAEKVNLVWGETGKTPHQILTAATRYRSNLSFPPEQLHPENVNRSNTTPEKQRLLADQVSTFASVYHAVSEQLGDNQDIKTHPWFGVHNTELQVFDANHISELLNHWQQALNDLEAIQPRINSLFQSEASRDLKTISALASLQQELGKIPQLTGDEVLEPLPLLRGDNLHKSKLCQQLFLEILDDQTWLINTVGQPFTTQEHPSQSLAAASSVLGETVKPDVTLKQLAEALNRLDALQAPLNELNQIAQGIRTFIPAQAAEQFGCTPEGLKELKTFITLASEPGPDIWSHSAPLFDNELLDKLLPQLAEELSKLKSLQLTLSGTFSLTDLPDAQQVKALDRTLSTGGMFRWLKPDWRAARKQVLALSSTPQTKLAEIQVQLSPLTDYISSIQKLQQNTEFKNALGHHFQGLKTDISLLTRIRQWYAQVRSEYGIGFGRRVSLGESLLSLTATQARTIRSLDEQNTPQQLLNVLDELEALKQVFTSATPLHSPQTNLRDDKNILVNLKSSIVSAIGKCTALADQDELTIRKLCERITRLATLDEKLDRWQKADFDQKIFGGRLGLRTDMDADNSFAIKRLDDTLALATALETSITDIRITDCIRKRPTADTFETLYAVNEQLTQRLDAERHAMEAFSSKVQLVRAEWMPDNSDELAVCLSRNLRASNQIAALQSWLNYARERRNMATRGLSAIALAMEQGHIPTIKATKAFMAGLYDLLARELFQSDPELASFSGHSQSALQQQFAQYDNNLKALQCEQIAWQADQVQIPAGNASGRVSEHTELALIQRECSKKTRHIPIRQLMERAGTALINLKPCFMMGPMSVSQYLAPGSIEFDIVIMDEASQIKPEDALGALARGKQLIVVGDPKQLPPTSFFDRMIDDSEEDPTALETSESILDATLPIFTARRLRWHYRSQHESLIAFSNQAFYDSDLVLFPSPNKASDDYGVHFTRVQRGAFVNRRNIEESRIIADAICNHLISRPEESLGVVAMSAEQREQLERALDQLVKENPLYREAMENNAGRLEPLFIKNLENVQGDERDVIFISMTYGPQEPGGRVLQRFGPITGEDGWRRLNVLFTRSKRRMHIFSSMGSNDILIGPTSKRGVKAMRDFLSYCETGILHTTVHETGRPPDSDFEIAVMERLRAAGFDCVPQVGVAGFFIDLAVVDPANPSHYLMGIECDGATYHSAKSVRDRDRLRQAVLERLGWNIRRIWSTDWFKNPDGELAPIIRELRQLSATTAADAGTRLHATTLVDEVIPNEPAPSAYEHYLQEGSSLQQRLEEFGVLVIRESFPDTPPNKRLLRPAMLDALLEFEPTSKTEFLELIPAYIRQGTDPAEGQFLDQIFEIINASHIMASEE